jgi:NTE family protein
MRAVAFVTKLIDQGRLADGKRMLIDVIEAEDAIREFPGSCRLNNEWDFLCHLHGVGRARADQWLAENLDHLGNTSTVDLEAKYF